MRFIQLQKQIEKATRYHSSLDPQIYTIDYPPSKSRKKTSNSDPAVAMTTQYDVMPFLQWYETHTMLRNTSANFEKLKTHIFSNKYFFFKSINSLFCFCLFYFFFFFFLFCFVFVLLFFFFFVCLFFFVFLLLFFFFCFCFFFVFFVVVIVFCLFVFLFCFFCFFLNGIQLIIDFHDFINNPKSICNNGLLVTAITDNLFYTDLIGTMTEIN